MVSVIIPVYNAEKYVEHAIESVLSQPEVSNIYLVDDASTDRSLEVINRIAAGSDRVTFITHSRMNIGAGATRNLAIGLVDTPYISFLDADDYYRPHRFTD
ncbi:MAG: glycosyltransferase, partial [Saprospiraceae bacterium]|nr:glycosyltransferase [Saprospiraceae bacterium]